MCLKIIPFEPRYSVSFKNLNLAWIQQYFEVKLKDARLSENCEQSIIKPGGFIYFAEYRDTIVGCLALIKINVKSFELGKMAVDPSFHGLKIGQKPLSFAIDFAKKKRWNNLVLYSRTKLDIDLPVYKKYGFKEVPLGSKITHLRSDIKIELLLQEP